MSEQMIDTKGLLTELICWNYDTMKLGWWNELVARYTIPYSEPQPEPQVQSKSFLKRKAIQQGKPMPEFDEPQEQMPLISLYQKFPVIQKCHIWEPEIEVLIKAQRDADMAWHNTQLPAIRAEFAEKVCEGLKMTCEDFDVSGKAYNAIVKSIKNVAMAKEAI